MSKDIINIISEITFCLLDVVLLYRFSLLSLKIKAHHNFIILLISLLTAFTAFGMSFISTYSWVSTLILLGSIIVYVLIVFQGQTKAKIVTALLYYLILGVLTMLVSSLAFVVFSITTNQLLENIDLEIVVRALQHGRDPLQPHAGVDRGARQVQPGSVRLLVELHEHQVPHFHEAVAVLVGRTRRAAGHRVALVVEKFGAIAARPHRPHLPDVAGVADDARLR